MVHLASMPISAFGSFAIGGRAARLVIDEASAYGLTSNASAVAGGWMPTSVPPREDLVSAVRPDAASAGARNDTSVFHLTCRRKLTPQTPLPSLNRIERNGMRSSSVHPPSNSAALASQSVFQFRSACSLTICTSIIPPWAL